MSEEEEEEEEEENVKENKDYLLSACIYIYKLPALNFFRLVLPPRH